MSDRTTKEPDASITAKIVNGLRERRVLISSVPGPHAKRVEDPSAARILEQNVDTFVGALDDVLQKIAL